MQREKQCDILWNVGLKWIMEEMGYKLKEFKMNKDILKNTDGISFKGNIILDFYIKNNLYQRNIN